MGEDSSAAERQQEAGDPDYVVFGAGGPTGLHTLETLVKLGFKVRAVVRKPEEHGEITYVARKLDEQPFSDAEIELVKGDVADPDSCRAACKGAKGVFFTASGKGYFSAYSVDYKGVENVAAAAKAHGVDRVVLISSAFVSPHRYIHPIRVILNSIRFRLMDYKFQGEEALRRSGVQYAIIRPGRLTDVRAGESPWEVCQGDNSRGGQGVARADVARIAVAAMLSPDTDRVTFEIFGKAAGLEGSISEPADALKALVADSICDREAGQGRQPLSSEGSAQQGGSASTNGGSGDGGEGHKVGASGDGAGSRDTVGSEGVSGGGEDTLRKETVAGKGLNHGGGIVNSVLRTLVML